MKPLKIPTKSSPKTDIGIAEPIDIQINELGNRIIQMYQLIGIISDKNYLGQKAYVVNYMNGNFYSKDEPATNKHEYRIIKIQRRNT